MFWRGGSPPLTVDYTGHILRSQVVPEPSSGAPTKFTYTIDWAWLREKRGCQAADTACGNGRWVALLHICLWAMTTWGSRLSRHASLTPLNTCLHDHSMGVASPSCRYFLTAFTANAARSGGAAAGAVAYNADSTATWSITSVFIGGHDWSRTDAARLSRARTKIRPMTWPVPSSPIVFTFS